MTLPVQSKTIQNILTLNGRISSYMSISVISLTASFPNIFVEFGVIYPAVNKSFVIHVYTNTHKNISCIFLIFLLFLYHNLKFIYTYNLLSLCIISTIKIKKMYIINYIEYIIINYNTLNSQNYY